MKNLLTSIFEKQKTEQEIIAEIHNEFDTAQERLLQQAHSILSKSEISLDQQAILKAERLKALGFVNTKEAKNGESLIQKKQKHDQVIISTKEQAELIEYYKREYPFQKFLTESELDRICEKYNLVYAPVGNYLEDVPEKNLREIELAKKLKQEDINHGSVIITELNEDGVELVGRLGKKAPYSFSLKEIIELNSLWCSNRGGYAINSLDHISDSNWFVIGGHTLLAKTSRYPRFKEQKIISNEGLFICAPKTHFDLKGLEKEGKFQYARVKRVEVKDPIVFRYVNGGIQVLSKWGLEASDELLLNPIDN